MAVDEARYALLDMSNLAYAHFHVIPHKIWITQPTTLAQAMAKTCRKLQEDLAVDTLAFCFDGGSTYRKSIYPEYKAPRKAARESDDEETKEARDAFFDQLRSLRAVHLPDIGAKNVLYSSGDEADDIMASCVKSLYNARKVYMVTSDEDLYQCIEGNRVVLYKPVSKKIVNETDFRAAHNDLLPGLYASAKAWCGCTSDNIPGVAGIGIKRAADFVQGKSNKVEVFHKELALFNRNIKLTRLPSPTTPAFKVERQETPIDWDRLLSTVSSARPRGVKQ